MYPHPVQPPPPPGPTAAADLMGTSPSRMQMELKGLFQQELGLQLSLQVLTKIQPSILIHMSSSQTGQILIAFSHSTLSFATSASARIQQAIPAAAVGPCVCVCAILAWGYIEVLDQNLTDYTKPNNLELNKAPTD